MPDFIAVAWSGSGLAGYARKDDVLSALDRPFPVYAEDLRTIVGQMVPGKGFVPAGVDPNAVPDTPVMVGPVDQRPPDRTDPKRGPEPNGGSLWIAVTSTGTISQGVGVPAWWGSAQSC